MVSPFPTFGEDIFENGLVIRDRWNPIWRTIPSWINFRFAIWSRDILRRLILHVFTKFHEDILIQTRVIAIFRNSRYSRWRPAAILDLSQRTRRPPTKTFYGCPLHHLTKFHRDRIRFSRDMAIWKFKMAAGRHVRPPSWICFRRPPTKTSYGCPSSDQVSSWSESFTPFWASLGKIR
jgi:hypothetical protein